MSFNILNKLKDNMSGQAKDPGIVSSPFGQTASQAVDVSKFTRLIRWLLYAAVFLVPVFFLPFTTEVREFNKQTLLFLLVVVMLAIWVVKILTTRSVAWVKTSLDFILLAYLIIYFLASYLSIDKVSSFLGYYGRYTGSFLSIISFVVLYFLVVNNVRSGKLVRNLTKILLASGALVMVYSFLQLLKVYVFRFDFAKMQSFNPIGSLGSLALFSAFMLVFIQWIWLNTKLTAVRQIIYSALTVLGLLIMFILSTSVPSYPWLVLGLTMVVFLAITMIVSGNKLSPSWFWKPMVILVIAILFFSFDYFKLNSLNPRQMFSSFNVPVVEVQLSNLGNLNLVKNALTSKPILGYGPGTTGIVYGDIKPDSMNKSIVWNLSFDRASSEMANIAIETGLLGLLAFEATSVLFIIYALYFILRKPDHPGRTYAFGFFMAWLFLYISHFFYFFNGTFAFLFWFLLAMFMAIAHWSNGEKEEKTLTFSNSPRAALSWMFASLLVLAVLLVAGFFQLSLFAGETSYASGIKELNKPNPDYAKAEQHLASAIKSNRYRDIYYLGYAQNLVFESVLEASKPTPDLQKFQNMIKSASDALNTATSISPEKASNWSAKAQFYGQLKNMFMIPNSDSAIVESWKQAAKLDPKNPALQVQLGLAYLNSADKVKEDIVGNGIDTDKDGLPDAKETAIGSNPNVSDSNNNGISDGDEVKAGFNPAGTGKLAPAMMKDFMQVDSQMLKDAEDALKKAIELKDNLADPYVGLARVYEKDGKLDLAKQILQQGGQKAGWSAELMYELGRITYNLKNYTDAEKIFNQVITAKPNYANAHYSLGLVYLQNAAQATDAENVKALRNKALAEFEKTREISGPNLDLEKSINDLKDLINNPPAK
ncbi:MAG: hypothetical protein ACM3KM_01180 [Acidobacteriaceae bacterium]